MRARRVSSNGATSSRNTVARRVITRGSRRSAGMVDAMTRRHDRASTRAGTGVDGRRTSTDLRRASALLVAGIFIVTGCGSATGQARKTSTATHPASTSTTPGSQATGFAASSIRGRWTIRNRRPCRRRPLRGRVLRSAELPAPSCARNDRHPPHALAAADCHSSHRQRRTLSAQSPARRLRTPGTHLQLPDLGPSRHGAGSSTPDQAHDSHLRPAPPPAGSTRVSFRLTPSRRVTSMD